MSEPTETSRATVVELGGANFLLQKSEKSINPLNEQDRFAPASVLHWKGEKFQEAEIEQIAREYGNDDVWSREFLEVIIVYAEDDIPTVCTPESEVILLPKVSDTDRLAPGPYLIYAKSGAIHPILKLVADNNDAFVGGVIPDSCTGAADDSYKYLRSITGIPIPSRLYSSSSLPLSGLRFALKDAIDLAGIPTSCGSRAYGSLQPPAPSTAPFVQQLLRAGATLVGKTRLTQFCDGNNVAERFEEPTPVNPRGDAFQQPSGSSSGSSVAAAAYDWLDFTIGSDTGGSTRHPAGVNGVFGLRPSHGSVESRGLVCAKQFDTVGLLTRSAAVAERVLSVMQTSSQQKQHDSNISTPRFKLFYLVQPSSAPPSDTPKFFPRDFKPTPGDATNASASTIFADTIASLSTQLHLTAHPLSIDDLWSETHPSNQPDDLITATGRLYQDIVYSTTYLGALAPFLANFRAQNKLGNDSDSRATPPFEPVTKARLDYGAHVTPAALKDSEDASAAFGAWVRDVLFRYRDPQQEANKNEKSNNDDDDDDDDDDAIPLLVYPQAWGTPAYRDAPGWRSSADGPLFWNGFSSYSISYCSGCPDVTVPVGQVAFHSKITGEKEYLPVALSVLAPVGRDRELLAMLAGAEREGLLRAVKTGARAF